MKLDVFVGEGRGGGVVLYWLLSPPPPPSLPFSPLPPLAVPPFPPSPSLPVTYTGTMYGCIFFLHIAGPRSRTGALPPLPSLPSSDSCFESFNRVICFDKSGGKTSAVTTTNTQIGGEGGGLRTYAIYFSPLIAGWVYDRFGASCILSTSASVKTNLLYDRLYASVFSLSPVLLFIYFCHPGCVPVAVFFVCLL